jgi:hypothetical protein
MRLGKKEAKELSAAVKGFSFDHERDCMGPAPKQIRFTPDELETLIKLDPRSMVEGIEKKLEEHRAHALRMAKISVGGVKRSKLYKKFQEDNSMPEWDLYEYARLIEVRVGSHHVDKMREQIKDLKMQVRLVEPELLDFVELFEQSFNRALQLWYRS